MVTCDTFLLENKQVHFTYWAINTLQSRQYTWNKVIYVSYFCIRCVCSHLGVWNHQLSPSFPATEPLNFPWVAAKRRRISTKRKYTKSAHKPKFSRRSSFPHKNFFTSLFFCCSSSSLGVLWCSFSQENGYIYIYIYILPLEFYPSHHHLCYQECVHVKIFFCMGMAWLRKQFAASFLLSPPPPPPFPFILWE